MKNSEHLLKRSVNIFQKDGSRALAQESVRYLFRIVTSPIIRLFPRYYNISHSLHMKYGDFDVHKYRAPLDPYKIEWVSPNQINNFSRRTWPRQIEFGKVLDGDWDTRDNFDFDEGYDRKYWKNLDFGVKRFESSIFYKSLKNHFQNGVPWKKTEYYNTALEAFEEGELIHDGFTNENELIEDLERTDILYDRINKAGYKTQTELFFEGMHNKANLREQIAHEIRVDIARNGELLYTGGGKHRLAIAKILDLDEVPVAFITRHKDWMEKRDSVYNDDLKIKHIDFREFK